MNAAGFFRRYIGSARKHFRIAELPDAIRFYGLLVLELNSYRLGQQLLPALTAAITATVETVFFCVLHNSASKAIGFFPTRY